MPEAILEGVIPGVMVGGFGLAGVWMSRQLFVENRQIEPVALLTKSSAKRLPEVETLVRASNTPPAQQQAELLRAAQSGQETPPEELLRPGQANRSHTVL